jgi:hypothetical protein
MSFHVQDLATLLSIESSLRQGVALGLVADADFATSEAVTLAAIDTRNAAVRPDLIPQVYAVKEAVKLGFKMLGATTMITDTATIYTAIQTLTGRAAAPGFAVAV